MERLAGEEENIYNNYWNSSQIYPIVDMFIIVTNALSVEHRAVDCPLFHSLKF